MSGNAWVMAEAAYWGWKARILMLYLKVTKASWDALAISRDKWTEPLRKKEKQIVSICQLLYLVYAFFLRNFSKWDSMSSAACAMCYPVDCGPSDHLQSAHPTCCSCYVYPYCSAHASRTQSHTYYVVGSLRGFMWIINWVSRFCLSSSPLIVRVPRRKHISRWVGRYVYVVLPCWFSFLNMINWC
jgi:hypothetical protein